MTLIASARPEPGTRGPRRDRRWAEILFREHEVRQLWRAAAIRGRLAEKVHSPSGATLVVPDLTAIHLGPPLRFTVHLRPAQIWEDAQEAGRHLANALGVPNVRFTELAPGWIEIEAPTVPAETDEPTDSATDATPELSPRPTRPLSPVVANALTRGHHRAPTSR
ncbi:hypothetical protein [Actinomycetospora straminea]|uniref:Uncharacterized protein n=1 Tax=Actinomycetospora straminea TaxID=663607 RepID=A0ABP9EBE0_9PSEU|nr:hypothetical protein [Actinomycetospora straminea]MDD7935955.1 hypothetical protein [Actinomycetospora straminea]